MFVADGDPDNADLEDALGSGIYDDSEDYDEEQNEPLSGASGGASACRSALRAGIASANDLQPAQSRR